jgi:hypothetical protein
MYSYDVQLIYCPEPLLTSTALQIGRAASFLSVDQLSPRTRTIPNGSHDKVRRVHSPEGCWM